MSPKITLLVDQIKIQGKVIHNLHYLFHNYPRLKYIKVYKGTNFHTLYWDRILIRSELMTELYYIDIDTYNMCNVYLP